jgi:hypothetical protein
MIIEDPLFRSFHRCQQHYIAQTRLMGLSLDAAKDQQSPGELN